MSKHKAFSLVEVMIVIGVVSLVLAISAPIFTKRIKNTNASGCVGGTKTVKKVFVNASTFTVPENIVGDVTVTMVGGGGPGSQTVNAYSYSKEIYFFDGVPQADITKPTTNCTVKAHIVKESDNNRPFVNYAIITAISGGSVRDCESVNGKAGDSGILYYKNFVNLKRDESLNMEYKSKVWHAYITDSSNNKREITLNTTQPNPGAVGSNGVPYILEGGDFNGYITGSHRRFFGKGASCSWDEENSKYKLLVDETLNGWICSVQFMRIVPGVGGGAGAYAKFNLSLKKGTDCEVTIGAGGLARNVESGTSSDGGDTIVKCTDKTTGAVSEHKVGGGKQASSMAKYIKEQTPGVGGSYYLNIPEDSRHNGGAGELAGNGVAGGKGGSVIDLRGNVFSEGRNGGCDGAMMANQCDNPHGGGREIFGYELYNPGAGGGGSSCNNYYCGDPGNGANGIVMFEYKTRCY